MRRLFYCFILLVLAFNAGCSFTKPIKKEHSLAFGSLWEGDTVKAREYLDTARDNYIKKFLLISVELSDGNLEKAEYYAKQFTAEYENIPDGKVLLNLIQRRKSFPTERWVHSYAMAWQEAGSPALKVLKEFTETEYDWAESQLSKDSSIEIPVCTFDYLLTSYGIRSGCDNKKDFEYFLGQINSELPVEMKLLLLYYLDSDVFLPDSLEITNELRQEIKRKRSDIIHQLSIELPLDMEFEIMDILGESSKEDPLSLKELEMLEKAVELKRLAPLPYELYSLYLNKFQSLKSKEPYFNAYELVSSSHIISPFTSHLMGRIDASLENATPEMKKRLANILEKLGKAHIKRKVLVDFLIGIAPLRSAYIIKGDTEAEERLMEGYNTIKKSFQIVVYSYASSLYLPIAPLMIDTIEYTLNDEIGFYLLLTSDEMPEVISEILEEPL